MTLNPGFNGSRFNGLDRVAVPTHDQDGHEAGDGGVPVSAGGGRLAHQDAVEDEISEAELHSPCRRGTGQRSTSTPAHPNQDETALEVEVNQTHCPAPARPPA